MKKTYKMIHLTKKIKICIRKLNIKQLIVCVLFVLGFNTAKAQEKLVKGSPIGNPTANGVLFDGITSAQNINNYMDTGGGDAWIGLHLPFTTAVVNRIRIFPRGMTETWVLDRIKGGRFD